MTRQLWCINPLERLDAMMSDVSDVYVIAGVNAEKYYADLAMDLKKVICTPFFLEATVDEPGFPNISVGSVISGQCVAHARGYWLVYQPKIDQFLCFWGLEPGKLSAPGIFGSPLGCWSA